MKTLYLFCFSILLVSCSPGSEEKNSNNSAEKDTSSVNKDELSNEFTLSRIQESFYVYPNISGNPSVTTGKVEFGSMKDGNFVIVVHYDDGTEDNLNFNGEKLVAKITPITFNKNYHQQLAVYLFEKQWHKDSVNGTIGNPDISRYEIVNPPKTNYWFLNAYSKTNPDKIVASYGLKIPEKEYAAIFEKINHKNYSDFKPFLFQAPPQQKIDYNSLRKLGRFNEGIVADLKDLKFDPDNIYSNSLIKKPENYKVFYESDFTFPDLTENGYDTVNPVTESLKDFHSVKAFSYKTSYTLNGTDSTLELQIDFKTKDNLATTRFVIGGVVFEKVPNLKSINMNKGLYLPLGFNSYNDPEIKMDAYVLMGNTSGFWMDNTYGRNIDGVLLYFDKTSKLKIHVWLMGGDGTIPVGHYVTTLNKLAQG